MQRCACWPSRSAPAFTLCFCAPITVLQTCPWGQFSAVPSLDVAAFIARPWRVLQLLPSAAVTPDKLSCTRVTFSPLLPTNASAGLVINAVSSRGGAAVPLDLFKWVLVQVARAHAA